MSNEVVNIYWAPQSTHEVSELGEWNMLYSDPVSLFDDLKAVRHISHEKNTFFVCPVTNSKFKKTYVFKNELASSYKFDFTGHKTLIEHTSSHYLGYSAPRKPSIATGPLVSFNLFHCFFADEPLEAVFTPPMFHEPRYTRYGTVIPGQFDIGQWFRPYAFECQMWNPQGQFHLEEQEPLFYVEFKTNKKINLQRFKMNATLHSYIKSCASYKDVWGFGIPLADLYARFNRTRMRELILKEIKQNLLDDFS